MVHDDKEDRVGDILGYLKAYNTHTKLSVLILYCVCMMYVTQHLPILRDLQVFLYVLRTDLNCGHRIVCFLLYRW